MTYRFLDTDDFDYDLDHYEEPPLYPAGHLEGLTDDALRREQYRQCRIHDSAVDRCEEINSPTIETAQARLNMIEREQKRRRAQDEIAALAWETEGGSPGRVFA